MSVPSFTYSSLSRFITCPKQYEAHHVLKYIPFADTSATLYGKDLHLAAENYIGKGEELPERFIFAKLSAFDVIDSIKELLNKYKSLWECLTFTYVVLSRKM
jgi:hypothetical protein